MKQRVRLKLRSVLNSADGENSESELFTEAYMERDGDAFVITYEESEATGFEGATTTITANGREQVTILRTGSANSCLVAEPSKKHFCLYGTPYGNITMGIYTHKIKNELTENGGSLYFKYTIDVNASYLSDNEIYLDVEADNS